jgi:hypothetical protein
MIAEKFNMKVLWKTGYNMVIILYIMKLGRSSKKVNSKMGVFTANFLSIMRVESLRKNRIVKIINKMV